MGFCSGGSLAPFIYRFYRGLWQSLDWLYPPRCGGCAQVGARWCARCRRQIHRLALPVCSICGVELTAPGICGRCLHTPPAYTALRSWALYAGPLQAAIKRLKYRGDQSLGEVLARPLIELLETTGWALDLITPVPQGVARRAERGYNQAALLARPLAYASGVRYRPQALSKIRATRSQVGLSLVERHQNVSGAFAAQPEIVAGKRVLVVDDVLTSGATMAACTQVLLDAQASAVFGITLARVF